METFCCHVPFLLHVVTGICLVTTRINVLLNNWALYMHWKINKHLNLIYVNAKKKCTLTHYSSNHWLSYLSADLILLILENIHPNFMKLDRETIINTCRSTAFHSMLCTPCAQSICMNTVDSVQFQEF